MSQLLNKLDTNNNGFIDYTEFLAGCMKSKIYLQEETLKHAFEYFDKVPFINRITVIYRTTMEQFRRLN
jgi:hypothetical protein